MKSLADRIANWFTGTWSGRELDRLGEAEVDRIAHDTGLSVATLHDLARSGPAAASLLPRRMAALGLDVARDEPHVLRDLQRVCAVCRSKGRCDRDLSRDPNDPIWQSYCPNAITLRSLQ